MDEITNERGNSPSPSESRIKKSGNRKASIQRPVIQITGHLACKVGQQEIAADVAIKTVLKWMAEKQGIPLPPQAEAGQSFELDASDSYPVSAVRFDEFWSVQFDKFDDVVPGRIWRTEATVAHTEDTAIAGIRLAVIDISASAEFSTSVPSVIGDLIRRPGLLDGDGAVLDDRPRLADTEHGTDELINLIRSEKRTRPVIVCSGTRFFEPVEEAQGLARRLAGLAHVVVLGENQSKRLTQVFGREFSVWGGAIRTYNVNFNPSVDEVLQHPIASREWLSSRFRSPERFMAFLRYGLASATVRGTNLEESLPAFRSIKQAAVDRKINTLSAHNFSERDELLSSKVDLLQQKVTELSAQYDFAAEEVTRAEEERDKYRSILISLRAKNDRLQKASLAAEKIQYPDNFEKLDEWVQEYFPGRLLLLNRAARAARKSPFQEPQLVFKCLERLATEYVERRRAGLEVSDVFSDLGVHLDRTGDENHLKQWKEKYFLVHRNTTRFFEWHLKKGSDKNETTTMRIYFFYDEDDEQVVVGHLPGHLTNSKS